MLKAKDWGNTTETAFDEWAKSQGYVVTKRGWPDFLCLKDGRVAAVEVKPRTKKGRHKHLKLEQVVSLAVLQKSGIDCYLSDGRSLEPFRLADHLPRHIQKLSYRTDPILLYALKAGILDWTLTKTQEEKVDRLLRLKGWDGGA